RAPDGGERVAEAEVDAADAPAAGRGGAGDDAAGEVGGDQALQRLERAEGLLAEPPLAPGAAVAFEEGPRDGRDLVGGALDAGPVVAAPGPGVPEEAALAVGGGQGDEPAVGDGEHGPDGAVEVVGDAGGLVDDQQADVGEAADGVLAAGQADDA